MNRLLKPLMAAIALCVSGPPAQAITGAGPYYAMPAWDQTLPVETRFVVLTNMNSEAVLDRETGLVWERSLFGNRGDFAYSFSECQRRSWGKKLGWRLPTVDELMTLVDINVSAPGPLLPPGHPFQNSGTIHRYWTATTAVDNPGMAYVVDFSGTVALPLPTLKTDLDAFQWCVRGR